MYKTCFWDGKKNQKRYFWMKKCQNYLETCFVKDLTMDTFYAHFVISYLEWLAGFLTLVKSHTCHYMYSHWLPSLFFYSLLNIKNNWQSKTQALSELWLKTLKYSTSLAQEFDTLTGLVKDMKFHLFFTVLMWISCMNFALEYLQA